MAESKVSMIQSEGHEATHDGNFAGVLASSDPQLVDCGLCDLCSLLSFIQVMLNLPEPDCATAHLLLLADTRGNSGHNSNSLPCEGTFYFDLIFTWVCGSKKHSLHPQLVVYSF